MKTSGINLVQPPLTQIPSEVQPNKPNTLVIILCAFVVVLIGFIGFLLVQNSKTNQVTVLPPTQAPTGSLISQTINSPTQPVSNQASRLLTGTVKELPSDLGIFIQTDDQKQNYIETNPKYYDAGTFISGKYKDYKRILAKRDPIDPSGVTVLTLVTKDYKTYILDKGNIPDVNYLLDGIDKTKVTNTDFIESDHTQSLRLDDKFSLYKNEIVSDQRNTGRKSASKNEIYEYYLVTDFKDYTPLNSPLASLKLYYKKITPFPVKDAANEQDKQNMIARNTYLSANTEVIAVDTTGLGVKYDLTNDSIINKYSQQKIQNDKYMLLKEPDKASWTEGPPNLRFKSNEIQPSSTYYSTYDQAFPGGCGVAPYTYVVNLNDSDLKLLGSTSTYQLFTLIDNNHPLYRMEYAAKILSWGTESGKDKEYPFDKYISKNPLLFMKDYWGRWLALGEYELLTPGGCGKPVIYLYPPSDTKVSVSFLHKMSLKVNIPTYKNQWSVMAHPDGSLTDLQPQFTNCNAIDSTIIGLEYAKTACTTNNYPYIYWSGDSMYRAYPDIKSGWIVNKSELTTFMNSKLDEVGLNSKEKSDMLEYWLPEMLQKNAPYYRISFLQTSDMNTLIPMKITPYPDTVFRIFLDYLPLSEKPNSILPTQQLQKLQRIGFTVVEWGGLKR